MSSQSAGVGSALPDQTGQSGNYLTTDGTSPSWASVGGGSITVGSFGSTPNSGGASFATGTLTLQPADGTHPGGVSTSTQTFGGNKTFGAGAIVAGTVVGASTGVIMGVDSGFTGIWINQSSPAFTNYAIMDFGSGATGINGPTSLNFRVNNVTQFSFNGGGTVDMTGLGAGGGLQLKSPDGTTYTLSIANGGTVHIV